MTAPTPAALTRLRLRPRASPQRPATGIDVPWRLAAGVGAAAVLATSAGDGFVAAALLGLAGGPWTGAGAALAVGATVARWGTADLGAVAGDQDVLGAALAAGPAWGVASSALAAVALLLVAAVAGVDRERRVVLAVASGIGAATLACGPAPTTAGDILLRSGASALGVAAALAVSTAPVRRLLPAWSVVVPGVAAVACALP